MAPSSGKKGDAELRWFQGIPRYAWLVLIIASLGWLFDTLDQNIFNLIRQTSLKDLMAGTVPADKLDATAKAVGGNLTAIFLIGWACGGLAFGVITDRIGRVRTMSLSILTYALFTGLNALVQTPEQYALCRFLTAFGVGGEFAAGAALVAEVWPDRSRGMALGTLQALSAVGNMGAALITLSLAEVTWRWVYVVGALPALLVIWIQLAVKEPDRWVKARDKARESGSPQKMGAFMDLWRDPMLRRNSIAGLLIAVAGVGGLWGVGFFMPDLIGGVFSSYAKADLIRFKSQAFFVQQVGAFLGIFAYAVLSERTGRKPALFFFFIVAFAVVEGAFWGVRSVTSAYVWSFLVGFGTLAPFSAFAVYFPELYPTRVRGTGVGFCYNSARFLAAAAPFTLGQLSRHFASATDETAGLRTAASLVALIYVLGFVGLAFAPETKGKPLME